MSDANRALGRAWLAASGPATREDLRWCFAAIRPDHFEQRLLAEPLVAATPRVAQTIREEHQEILLGIP